MDELEIMPLVRKCKLLKYRCMGVYAADNFPTLKNNSFQIVNASPANNHGSHWVLFCKRDNKVIFADPFGFKLEFYDNIYRQAIKLYDKVHFLMQAQLQPTNSNACGLYCLYLAHAVFSKQFPNVVFIGETDLYRFVKHMY